MPNINKNYVNKPFMLNLDNPEEKELYEWLRQQPARSFKQETKEYWMKRMEVDKKMSNAIQVNNLEIDLDEVRTIKGWLDSKGYYDGLLLYDQMIEFLKEKRVDIPELIEGEDHQEKLWKAVYRTVRVSLGRQVPMEEWK